MTGGDIGTAGGGSAQTLEPAAASALDAERMSAALDEAVAFIRAVDGSVPTVGVILGSGLGPFVDALEVEHRIPYPTIPHFPTSTVTGHAGALVLGRLGSIPVAVLSGRVHLYEGYSASQVAFPARVLGRLGVGAVVLTNASGGIHPDFRARDIMVIRDQLNLTGRNPLVGPNIDGLGPRFPDMTSAFDPDLAVLAHRVAADHGLVLREGVYAGVLGPSYETPAEIRMLRTLGADAVGMSTVYEVIALRHMSVPILGLSCITNLAAGLSATPLSHDEVKAEALGMQARLTRLVTAWVTEAVDLLMS